MSTLPPPGRALVVGLAKSGRAAALLLRDLGWEVVAVDRAEVHAADLEAAKRAAVTNAAAPSQEWPSVVRRRRFIVFVVLVIGAVLWILGSVGRPVGGRRYWY